MICFFPIPFVVNLHKDLERDTFENPHFVAAMIQNPGNNCKNRLEYFVRQLSLLIVYVIFFMYFGIYLLSILIYHLNHITTISFYCDTINHHSSLSSQHCPLSNIAAPTLPAHNNGFISISNLHQWDSYQSHTKEIIKLLNRSLQKSIITSNNICKTKKNTF
ncbi:unnamed protein product [Musa acuminata subsp. malaccensis]|uniref:(wild Malaysian banana) hypothetical protein n=1 Tax=Musa acuminata subsp. malaccensis TaxID=214687 RepID=A0A804IVX9_MUSAM|nr:unnamed protein product [Musa acuminata subsp. malaccensis]